MAAGCNEDEREGAFPVYWPSSGKYAELARSATVTPSNALALARSFARAQGQAEVMWPEPLLLIGNNYLFGVPEKDHVVLDGYLVDRDSGEVRRVKSKITLAPADKSIRLEEVLKREGG